MAREGTLGTLRTVSLSWACERTGGRGPGCGVPKLNPVGQVGRPGLEEGHALGSEFGVELALILGWWWRRSR